MRGRYLKIGGKSERKRSWMRGKACKSEEKTGESEGKCEG